MPTWIAEYAATPARRRTLWLVAANFLVFAVLVIGMFYVRSQHPDWPVPFEFGSLLMVSAMPSAAGCASITRVVGAHRAAKKETEEAVRWIAIAIASWLIILFLEMVE